MQSKITQPFPFDLVVFDLDGTLVDTSPDLSAALNHTLHELGRRQLSTAEIVPMIGRGVRVLVEKGLSATGDCSSALVDRTLAIFVPRYEAHLTDASRPYDGAEMALDQLEERGVRLAICTNKPERATRLLLKHFGWLDRFRAVIGGDSLATRKPDPAPLQEAILRAGGGRAILVGDSIIDVETARAASLPMIAVTFGFRDRPAEKLGATALIDRFDHLLPALQQLA